MEERMEELIKNNYSVLKLRATYSGMDSEDIFQTARCAYCFDEEIDKMVLAGNMKKAGNKLCRGFYKLIKHENMFGMPMGDNYRLQKISERLINETDVEYPDIETELENVDLKEILLNQVKEILDKDKYKFIIDYYTMGSANVAELYGITKTSARRRAQRIVQSVRDVI